MMTPRVQRIANLILALTVDELRELRGFLDDQGGGSGVREPRRPQWPDGTSSVSITIDPDDPTTTIYRGGA